ncbi:YfcC family protein [Tenuifilum osseticum]|uniref:YfcC family protein n=1 Tax=Tenuifilum osseticum TaxID=3374723 RepID=UPI0034E40530
MSKKIVFPHTIVIIIFIMIGLILLTWILPAGEFEKQLVNGRKVIVPGTYHQVSGSPQGLGSMLTAPIKGFIEAAQVIGFCLIVGGAFGMLARTKAIPAALNRLLERGKDNPRLNSIIVPIVMVFFSLAGATFGMSESTLVFVMITIPLAIALGYDSIVGISMSFMAAGVGFAAAITNPFNIGVAHGIAELPLFSGWEFRVLIWTVLTSIAIFFVMRYANRIKRNLQISSVYEIDRDRSVEVSEDSSIKIFDIRQKIIIGLLFISLILLVYGANQWKWFINEISALFIALGILSAVVYRLKTLDAVDAFINGAKDMVTAGLIIGMSRGLLVIASQGKIIDTILYSVSGLGKSLPPELSVQVIFIFQSLFTFLVPSGSGQAALTVPIVAPLSDLLEVGRQTAVTAFHLGDGLFSMLVPTSGVTMGVLSIAKIPYTTWVKWFIRLLLILFGVSMILLVFALYYFGK